MPVRLLLRRLLARVHHPDHPRRHADPPQILRATGEVLHRLERDVEPLAAGVDREDVDGRVVERQLPARAAERGVETGDVGRAADVGEAREPAEGHEVWGEAGRVRVREGRDGSVIMRETVRTRTKGQDGNVASMALEAWGILPGSSPFKPLEQATVLRDCVPSS